MSGKRFFCIDGHTCGSPVRVVAGGVPFLKGNTMAEKREDFLDHHDWIRTALMFEPRGHDMMSGSMLFPPSNPKNDVGVLFIETSGCLPMCGHGTIGTVTIAIEEGLITPKVDGQLILETPAGEIHVSYKKEGDKVKSVKLTNIASFLFREGIEAEVEGLGKIKVDVSYGGNFYAIVDPQENFSGVENYSAEELIVYSRKIREVFGKLDTFQHPTESHISGLSHVLWTGKTIHSESDGRNAVFYGEKAIDRSPCGTGTSARLAQLYAKGQLSKGDTYIHESFIGSQFTGRIEDTITVGEYQAIIPSVDGWARITGYNTILVDKEDDPYAHGFQVI